MLSVIQKSLTFDLVHSEYTDKKLRPHTRTQWQKFLKPVPVAGEIICYTSPHIQQAVEEHSDTY